MANLPIEQATFSRSGEAAPVLLAKSPGFLDEWEEKVRATLTAFGARPVGISCPLAVFAQPLGRKFILVVQVADLDQGDAANRPLGFHVLVVPRKAYLHLWHDPFLIAERVPPDWQARGTLPTLSWSATPLAGRTVQQVRQVLQRVKGKPLSEEKLGEEQMETAAEGESESPALLGGVQVLVDGGKLVFHRPRPDSDVVKALWALLPNSNRGEVWPASFAFSNTLGFDIVVVPRYNADDFRGYTTEELAAEYPEGKYEFALQSAAEGGDQQELNALFERRSARQTWRIGVVLVIGVSLMVALTRIGLGPPTVEVKAREKRSAIAAGLVGGLTNPLNGAALVPLARDAWNKAGEED